MQVLENKNEPLENTTVTKKFSVSSDEQKVRWQTSFTLWANIAHATSPFIIQYNTQNLTWNFLVILENT